MYICVCIRSESERLSAAHRQLQADEESCVCDAALLRDKYVSLLTASKYVEWHDMTWTCIYLYGGVSIIIIIIIIIILTSSLFPPVQTLLN